MSVSMFDYGISTYHSLCKGASNANFFDKFIISRHIIRPFSLPSTSAFLAILSGLQQLVQVVSEVIQAMG
jgi:hypothetical protein